MADQRNPFRFRLPWAAPAPVAAAPRQGAAPAPAPPRPPFRPPGAAPVRPPTKAELSAPPPTSIQPEGGSKPASPKTPKQTSTATPPKAVQPPGSPVAKQPQATTTSPRLPRSPPQATTTSLQPPRSPPSPQATTTSLQPPRSPPSPQATTASPRPPRSPPSLQATTSPRLPRSPPPPQATPTSPRLPRSPPSPHSNLKPIPESESYPKESEEVKRILDEPIRKQQGGPDSSRKPAKTSIPSHPKAGARNHYPGGCGSEAHSPKEIKGDTSRFLNMLGAGQANQTLDSNRQMTIITLAGENRGASMTLGNESKQRETSIHIHRGYKTNPDESSEESSHEEGRKKPGDSRTDENSRAYMNSNVQGVNNSLVLNGTISMRNPGVHYVLSRSSVEQSDGRGYEMRKAEFNASSSEKHTVRRRCLGSLLMESSDSDANNPGKPRRHGCRYDCRKKNKDGSPGAP